LRPRCGISIKLGCVAFMKAVQRDLCTVKASLN
jgi:hypothetical protein